MRRSGVRSSSAPPNSRQKALDTHCVPRLFVSASVICKLINSLDCTGQATSTWRRPPLSPCATPTSTNVSPPSMPCPCIAAGSCASAARPAAGPGHAAARLPTLPAAGAAQRRARPDGGAGRSGRVRSEHAGNDGSRLLVEWPTGRWWKACCCRDGLCVSTQVGCAVGCRFCMTGKSGLIRQVTSMEILAQVVLARHARGEEGGFHGHGRAGAQSRERARSHRSARHRGRHRPQNLVFSTVGDPRVFEALPRQRIKPRWRCRCTTKAELRAHLLPRAPRIAPEALVELGEQYARDTGYPIQYQWTLLRASTTATTSSTPSCACSRASTACSTSFLQQPGRR